MRIQFLFGQARVGRSLLWQVPTVDAREKMSVEVEMGILTGTGTIMNRRGPIAP